MKLKILTTLLLTLTAAPALAHDMPGVCPGHGKGTVLRPFSLDGGKITRYQSCVLRGLRPTRTPRNILKATHSGSGDPPTPCQISDGVTVVMTACPNQTCGDFDDDYRLAQDTAISICTSEAVAQQATAELPAGGTVLAVFNGPAQFTGTDHHAQYQRSMGGYGVCVFCPAPAQEPVYD